MRATLRPVALCAAFVLLPFVGVGCDDLTGPEAAATPGPGGTEATTNTTAEACRGTLGAIRVENVTVPSGASCTLSGTIVQGNVFVRNGSELRALGARIGGNIQAEGARSVLVTRGTAVGGNVQLKQGGRITLQQTTVDGDIQLEENVGAILAEGNRVGGNFQVKQNTGGVTLNANRVAENLQCQANRPPPGGSGNVAGDKEDQCENL